MIFVLCPLQENLERWTVIMDTLPQPPDLPDMELYGSYPTSLLTHGHSPTPLFPRTKTQHSFSTHKANRISRLPTEQLAKKSHWNSFHAYHTIQCE